MRSILIILSVFFFASCQAQVWTPKGGRKYFKNEPTGGFESGDGIPFYIFSGQSNMGRSQTSDLTTQQQTDWGGEVPNTKIFIPAGYIATPINTSNFQNMDPGINTYLSNYIDTDEFGPETSLMKTLQNNDPRQRRALKFAVGNTDLAVGWASGSLNRGYLYSAIDRAAFLADSMGERLNLIAFIWMQGENDATNLTWANNYETNLASFMTAFATKWQSVCTTYGWTYNPNFLKVIGRINGASDASQVYRTTVRAAQANYCSVGANNAILIDTDSYPLRDNVHYNATGQIQFGIDIYNAIKVR